MYSCHVIWKMVFVEYVSSVGYSWMIFSIHFNKKWQFEKPQVYSSFTAKRLKFLALFRALCSARHLGHLRCIQPGGKRQFDAGTVFTDSPLCSGELYPIRAATSSPFLDGFWYELLSEEIPTSGR